MYINKVKKFVFLIYVIFVVIFFVGCNNKNDNQPINYGSTLYEKEINDFFWNNLDDRERRMLVMLGLAYKHSYGLIGFDLMAFDPNANIEYNRKNCINMDICNLTDKSKYSIFETYKDKLGRVLFLKDKNITSFTSDLSGLDNELKDEIFAVIDKLFENVQINIVENSRDKKVFIVDNKTVSITYKETPWKSLDVEIK